MDNPIKLRGHHLSTFANYFWGTNFYLGRVPNYNPFFNQTFEELKLRKNLQYNKKRKLLDGSDIGYGKIFIQAERKIFRKIIAEPKTKVQIVKGLDSICNSSCKKKG